MPWTVTTGTITGTIGDTITMLDLELVTNRGWTKEFTDTNKAVYRNGAASQARRYFRVVDSAQLAQIWGYNTMTDVDTGTGDFPTAVQLASGIQTRKSATADAVLRSYVAAGDDRTFILFIANADVAGVYSTLYMGDGDSIIPGDDSFSCLIGRYTSTAGVTAEGLWLLCGPIWSSSLPFGSVGANHRNTTRWIGGTIGVAGSVAALSIVNGMVHQWASGLSSAHAGAFGFEPFPNAAGGLSLADIWMITDAGGGLWNRRGRLRGLYVPCHPYTAFSDGDTFNGTGELASMGFRIVRSVGSYSGYSSTLAYGAAAVATSNPPSLL